ncbi:hypothetical protein PPERSA_03938 [Pseudocohnilembus persalinus]|uniref:Uncharacterized protein n=1 Tax=Pseudocohnilembus persalinus TaxID=266149 RepID=A0A0V0R5V3_PSEPJ|nr:hypothetical protein PPERSA_03938 [Pseudocohnilembus persalinus]|eukprot:KRX09876.1 hypothetical protein PPERSA_03938 [Pseudocohnilembus persalinus]
MAKNNDEQQKQQFSSIKQSPRVTSCRVVKYKNEDQGKDKRKLREMNFEQQNMEDPELRQYLLKKICLNDKNINLQVQNEEKKIDNENIVTKFDIYNEINPQNFQKTACMKCILSLNL